MADFSKHSHQLPQAQHRHSDKESGPRFYDYFWTWTCDNCRQQGGMTTNIPQCPECDHHRCVDCSLDLQVKGTYGSLLRKPTSSSASYKHAFTSNTRSTNEDITSRTLRASSFMTDSNSMKSLPETLRSGMLSHTAIIAGAGDFLSPLNMSLGIPEVQVGLQVNPTTPPSTLTSSPSSIRSSTNPSETFSTAEGYLDSETELGSDSADDSEDSSDDDDPGDEFHHSWTVLESRLFLILCHDLALAARLIPQVHDNVVALLRFSHPVGTTVGTLDSTSGATPSQGALSTASSTPASGETSASLQRPKRDRESDQNDDDQDNGNPKKARARPPEDLFRQSEFACHFHKRDPRRYNPHIDRKYLRCICPAPSELRHIKDHFKAFHRPSQCDKCFAIFKDIDELVDHRSSEPCHQRSSSLREGIDDSQWDKIGSLLRKRRMKHSGMAQHIEKWFGIWDILFPSTARPSHPWNENVYNRSAALPPDSRGILSTVNAWIEYDILEGNLQRNAEFHRICLRAVRMALDGQVPSNAEDFRSSQSDINCSPRSSPVEPLNTGITRSPLEQRLGFGSVNPPSDSRLPVIRGYPEIPFSIRSQDQRLRDPPTDETTPSHIVQSVPSQATRNSARGSHFEADPTFTDHSNSQQYPPLPASVHHTRMAFESGEPHYLQMDFKLEEDQLSQNSLEEFVDFNPTLSSDSMEFTSFDMNLDEQSQHSLGDFDNDGYELGVDVDADNNSLAVPLEFENELPEAMAPWQSRYDGNRFLWQPWTTE